ncbi:DeoR/GlpR family DNA-binding transcription regulator [Vagococcus hydrophili]|uniref:DeoR/GlpR transcriptional regulator n=1 Tax=Vagococcus hydrophili TaxID=2714947 RepID=A0A6G8AS12_9ENTE|nr:DeoR/GlpR family DNA-binding transcription regulator [Vagococcus hydrophili]QIL47854.1 DeoR/GlpR transcriptional regulator [Vagococcus hydrophili]
MNQDERLIQTIQLLEEKKQIKQEELMNYFNISKDTARRDILKLLEQDLAERTKGGIKLPVIKQQLTDYQNRLITHSFEKETLTKKAHHLIQENQTIWLDVSTTVELLGKEKTFNNTLFVTNSVDNAVRYSENKNNVYLLSGYYQPDSHLLTGPMIISQLNHFHFDIAFIGASGVSKEGIFFDELDDLELHQQLKQQAKKVVLLVDSTKINQTTSFKINWENIDLLVTNQTLPNEIQNELLEHNIQIISE